MNNIIKTQQELVADVAWRIEKTAFRNCYERRDPSIKFIAIISPEWPMAELVASLLQGAPEPKFQESGFTSKDDFWRRKVLAEKAHTWSDRVDKLIKGLDACHPTLPLSLWRFPDELGGRIDGAKSLLEPQVECALLFLQPRIFIFSPEKGKPESGWKDFYDFVLGYRSLVKTFRSDFTQYYWGIYPSNA